MDTKVSNEMRQFHEEQDIIMEREAQVHSVLRILQDAKDQLQLSMMLPNILSNPFVLRNYLKNDKSYDEASELLTACLAKLKIIKKEAKNVRSLEDADLINHETIRLIDFLQHHHGEFDIPSSWMGKLDDHEKSLLSAMDLLYNITEQRLQRSALEELRREKEINKLHYESQSLQTDIENMEAKAVKQKSTWDWKNSSREVVIQKLEEELSFKKWDNSVRVQKEIIKSNQTIKSIHTTSLLKQKELEDVLESTKKSYDKLLNENLEAEKRIRAEKNKLLLQLQSLVKKYDTTIGDKMKESIRLSEKYEVEKEKFDIFMIEFTKEEEQYDRIVRSREEEDKRIFEQNLALFIMNRAAKLIQSAWRRFRREKYGIKKGKGKGKGAKGKGKKK